jgi:hypothetical protein
MNGGDSAKHTPNGMWQPSVDVERDDVLSVATLIDDIIEINPSQRSAVVADNYLSLWTEMQVHTIPDTRENRQNLQFGATRLFARHDIVTLDDTECNTYRLLLERGGYSALGYTALDYRSVLVFITDDDDEAPVLMRASVLHPTQEEVPPPDDPEPDIAMHFEFSGMIVNSFMNWNRMNRWEANELYNELDTLYTAYRAPDEQDGVSWDNDQERTEDTVW